jgi:hypothetical protein
MVTKEAKKEPVISTEVKPEAIDRNRNPATKKTEPTKGGGTCNSGHARDDNNSSLWSWRCVSHSIQIVMAVRTERTAVLLASVAASHI